MFFISSESFFLLMFLGIFLVMVDSLFFFIFFSIFYILFFILFFFHILPFFTLILIGILYMGGIMIFFSYSIMLMGIFTFIPLQVFHKKIFPFIIFFFFYLLYNNSVISFCSGNTIFPQDYNFSTNTFFSFSFFFFFSLVGFLLYVLFFTIYFLSEKFF